MRYLFQGKRKFFSIPILLILGLMFLPLIIGGGLAYLAYKKIPNQKVKYAVLALITLFTLPIGREWIVGDSSSSSTSALVEYKKNNSNVAVKKTPSASLIPTLKPSPTTSEKIEATFLRVVDGDTLEVSVNGKRETVRIIGIDTPEVVDPRKTVECFGKEASDIAKKYFEVTDKKIWLEADVTQGNRDKYQRLLRYIFTDDDSIDFGKFMISLGYASEYTYSTPYKYQAIYKQAEREARDGQKGLWANNACVGAGMTIKQPVVTYSNINTSGNLTKEKSGTTNTSSGGDKDCKDFSSQSEAQAYFNSKGGSASNNVDRLDGSDHDGLVCESLP